MAEIRAQVSINASPEAVFDFIDDWPNAMRYLKRVVRYDIVDPDGGTGVGARFRIAVQAGPSRLDGNIVVTEHERPSRIAFKTTEGTRVDGKWLIRPEGSGTHVTLDAYYEPPGGLVGRVVAAFIRQNAQNDLNGSLRELKRLVESQET